ncbi:MAG: pyruvate dehydrogenase complex dihydrolipoamide acetyltransferase [Pseudomonadota bacterium]
MPIDILMPALSPTMEEGNLAKWLVKEGDSVSSGDVLAEIETDKATMEVEAVDEGVIGKILVDAGTENVKVNAKIAVLLEEGEDASAIGSGSSDAAPQAAPAAAVTEAAPSAPAPAPAASQASAGPAPISGGNRLFASPLARRLAKIEGLDLAKIAGTGPHGRIVKRDIEEAVKGGSAKAGAAAPASAPAAAPAAAPQGMSDDAVLKLFAEGSYEIKPHDNMRKTIAKRLTESSQTIPSYFLSVDCELDGLMKLRAEVNGSAPMVGEKPAFKVSVNDFIIKALALGLKAVPEANASWTDGGMVVHKHADIGVAVAIEGGLITPIVQQAEMKTLSAISNEVKDLASRAKSRKLAPAEYQGGTTAVSNLGMFGVKEFTSIINPPHASIVSIGAGNQRAVVKNGELVAATVMTATFAFDHRVIDGAVGAQLAAAFKDYLENPMSMLV